MKKLITLLLFFAHLSVGYPQTGDTNSSKDAFAQQLETKYPSTKGSKLEPATSNFWQVTSPAGEVVFVSSDLKLLIRGELTDLENNKTYPSAQSPQVQTIDITKLDIKNAIQFGSGQRKLYVFSDPDCPFCRQLEPELSKLTNTTIYIFPYPIEELHPKAKTIAQNIWCAQDKQKAWKAYLQERSIKKLETCKSTAIDTNMAIGNQLGISATPTLIFSDGTVIPGAMSASQINALLDGKK